MQKCIDLAKKGIRLAAPNPSVGALLVYQNRIIGQGVTSPYGGHHAEVNCINSVQEDDQPFIKSSILYVSLEPCSHYGKTPPCSNLIIKHQIPKVIVGCIDSFSEVSGKGIERMKQAGIEVIVGVLEKKSKELNKRFFTFHNKKRPYIILKWAETKDGFIDIDRSILKGNQLNNWITSSISKKIVHQWRAEEQAILVGTNTAINDNPQLNVRETEGKNPLRVVLDLKLRLPQHLNLFDQTIPTLIFNYRSNQQQTNLEYIKLNENKDLITQILNELYNKNIQSIIIEGGAKTLNTFINQNLWDEARVFIGNKYFKKGLKAPIIKKDFINKLQFDTEILNIYMND